MKILITGVSGAGKSTISNELKNRGFLAVDFTDIEGLCCWRNKETKEIVKYSPINDIRWFDLNERICDSKKLKQYLNMHENIVVSGLASGNYLEYLGFFDKVLLLQCKPETFVNRMINRIPVYGKTKAEQDNSIELQKELDSTLISYGAISINTEEKLDIVIGKIINEVK